MDTTGQFCKLQDLKLWPVSAKPLPDTLRLDGLTTEATLIVQRHYTTEVGVLRHSHVVEGRKY